MPQAILETRLASLMDDTIFIVQTTLSKGLNDAEVGFWAQSIIDSNLAACVQISESRSVYRWKGETISEPEWSVKLKTTKSKVNLLIDKIKLEHSYETPEILFWAVESTEEYSQWVKGE
jgi:periplasmic divalent cation tolerance protein